MHTAKAMMTGGLLAALAGCASITTGKEQSLAFATDPAGADCTLFQSGTDVARFKTPSTVTVHRSNNPLTVACSKPGYHQMRAMISTTISDGAWGNLLVGGIVGVMVDQSTGAAYRYYDPPRLSLVSASEAPPETSRLLVKGVTLLPPTAGPAPGPPASEAAVAETPPAPVVTPTAAVVTPPAPVVAAPARPDGSFPAAGVWECGLKSETRYYKLQFVVAADHSIVVTSYANAPATIVKNDPLTLTAINPRGVRQMNIVWNADNTMVITGPTSSVNISFRNEGACAKV